MKFNLCIICHPALENCARYDHFAVLCELLPAAIPSVVLNLALLTAGAHTVDVSKNANRLLLCDAAVELMSPEALMRNANQVNNRTSCLWLCHKLVTKVFQRSYATPPVGDVPLPLSGVQLPGRSCILRHDPQRG